MPLDRAEIAGLRHVVASLHYAAPSDRPFRSYAYDAPPDAPRNEPVYVARQVAIRDVRLVAGRLSLDDQGMALIDQPSTVTDFGDEALLRRIYYPETIELVKATTGARRVVVFDHTIRRRIPGARDRAAGLPRQPVPRIHNDYTETSAPQRLAQVMGDEAVALSRGRYLIVNVWRPIRGPLQDMPLALCDARSVATGDLAAAALVYPDRTGETYAVHYNPDHRWYYAPEMGAHEAWIFKCFDSDRANPARFAPHTAFDDPTAPADRRPRESIELRTLVFF